MTTNRNFYKSFIISLLVTFCAHTNAIGQVKNISTAQLLHYFQTKERGVYIVNFWATFCAPCLKEMPDFEHFAQKNKNIALTFVSLDLPEKRVFLDEFVKKKQLKAPVWYLNETNANQYIPAIHEQWDGTLPATLFINTKNNKRLFLQKTLSYQELEKYYAQIK
jgi:thiol-disulfide isomerase/thioredoxin